MASGTDPGEIEYVVESTYQSQQPPRQDEAAQLLAGKVIVAVAAALLLGWACTKALNPPRDARQECEEGVAVPMLVRAALEKALKAPAPLRWQGMYRTWFGAGYCRIVGVVDVPNLLGIFTPVRYRIDLEPEGRSDWKFRDGETEALPWLRR